VLIHNAPEEPAGIDLFLPAGYDLVWSALVLVLLAGLATAVVLVIRALTRRASGGGARRAQDGDDRGDR
jgi:hypothetical protein